MFITALNVALGLDAAAALRLEIAGSQTTCELHTAGFLLTSPAAFAGAAFFAMVAGALARVAWLREPAPGGS
jgi:hypothetical protein